MALGARASNFRKVPEPKNLQYRGSADLGLHKTSIRKRINIKLFK